MREQSCLTEIIDKKIFLITINNPEKMNALNSAVRAELIKNFQLADNTPEYRVVILTGAGQKAFCAGADIKELKSSHEREDSYNAVKNTLELCTTVERMSKPVIFAVNGYAIGGGMELCAGADMIIASETAIFGLPEVDLGIAPMYSLLRLGQIIGLNRAKEVMMTGKRINAYEAYEMGLVNKVVSSDKLLNEAINLAAEIASKSELAIRGIKRGLNRNFGAEEYEYALLLGTLMLNSYSLKREDTLSKNK